jgi:hypothetical protein
MEIVKCIKIGNYWREINQCKKHCRKIKFDKMPSFLQKEDLSPFMVMAFPCIIHTQLPTAKYIHFFSE